MEHNVKCKNYFYNIDYNCMIIDMFIIDKLNEIDNKTDMRTTFSYTFLRKKLNAEWIECRSNAKYHQNFILLRLAIPYDDSSKLSETLNNIEKEAAKVDEAMTIMYGAAYLECKHDVYLMFVESEKEKANETNGGTVSQYSVE